MKLLEELIGGDRRVLAILAGPRSKEGEIRGQELPPVYIEAARFVVLNPNVAAQVKCPTRCKGERSPGSWEQRDGMARGRRQNRNTGDPERESGGRDRGWGGHDECKKIECLVG